MGDLVRLDSADRLEAARGWLRMHGDFRLTLEPWGDPGLWHARLKGPNGYERHSKGDTLSGRLDDLERWMATAGLPSSMAPEEVEQRIRKAGFDWEGLHGMDSEWAKTMGHDHKTVPGLGVVYVVDSAGGEFVPRAHVVIKVVFEDGVERMFKREGEHRSHYGLDFEYGAFYPTASVQKTVTEWVRVEE